MRVEGIVVKINPRNGMFIVRLDDGPHCVYELLEAIDIAVGDRIAGEHNALASQLLTHLDQGQTFEAYGQSGDCSLQHAMRCIAA